MADKNTNVDVDTTQVTDVDEANTVEGQQTQTEDTNVEGAVENSNDELNGQSEDANKEQDEKKTIEELNAKLKEYELRDEEEKMLKEQLGLQDVDTSTYNYMNLDQQIVNEGKQIYLRLCNEYGIDANPNNIDESVKKLKETDPAKAYEFERKFERLGEEVEYKRLMVQQENNNYEIGKFAKEYGQLLNSSPALSNIMTQYVENYGAVSANMYDQLKSVMDIIMPAYQEAFNAGRQYALQSKAKEDTSAVSGGIATANTQTYNNSHVFTRDQISKMSIDEFSKYEKQIMQQMREGKIN